MAGRSEGYRLLRDERTGLYTVRFRHPVSGERVHRSTGEKDPRRAQEAAARLFAEAVTGPPPKAADKRIARQSAQGPIDVPMALWLASEEGRLDVETSRTYQIYARAHFVPFFASIDRFTAARGDEYMRARLRLVRVKTVRKELSALRGFLRWAVEHGVVPEVFEIASPPKNATGTADSKGRFKPVKVELDPLEIAAILERLPETSKHGTQRAYYRVLYETGLRRATLAALRVPEDYSKGQDLLIIRDEIDKARFGREVPLSAVARAELDAVCPEAGLIFGKHQLKETVRTTARLAGLPERKAAHVSDHDFRHARITHLLETTRNLIGVAYLVGHRNATTTNRYARPNRRAALDVIARAGGTAPQR